MSLLKKLFVYTLLFTTIATVSGLNTVKAAGSYGAGSLLALQGATDAAVYYIGSDGDKYVFPDSKTFFTWYPDFSDVVRVPVSELDMYPDGGAVTYRPGTYMVTHMNTAKVYAVEPGGVLRWIPDEATAIDLYGSAWASMVRDVIPGYFSSSYTTGADLADEYPTGTLVKVGETVYYIDEGAKRPFANADAFEANGFDWDNVMTVTDLSAYDDGSSITGEEEALSGFMPGEGGGLPVNPGELSVSLASDTPSAGVAYEGGTHVAFTKIKLTAGADPVTIDSLTIQRTGVPASDAAFSGINVMVDDYELLNQNYKSLNSDHQAAFTKDIVVPANSTKYITLVGKMIASLDSYSGEMPTLSLVDIDTDADLTASLPIVGNYRVLNHSVAIGTATISESPDLGTLTEEVGTTDVELLNVNIDNGSSNLDLDVRSIRFYNNGSADGADIDNVELVVDGNVIATSELDGKYVSFDLSSCGTECTIAEGKDETYQLRADIIGGSGLTLDFDIRYADDIFVYDTLNGSYVTPSAAIDGGRIVTISRGILTVSKTNTVAAGNIGEDADDLSLGSWNFRVQGEPITINSIKLDIDVTGTVSSSDFTNLRLYDSSGDALTGNADGADGSSSAKDGSVTFSDAFTLPEGDNDIILKGTLSADSAENDTVQFGVDFTAAANLDATGETTGESIALSATPASNYANPYGVEIDANLQTVSTLALVITTLSTPATQTIAPGTNDHLYSTIRFDAADSSEDVKVTAFEFYITTGGNAKTNDLTDITFVVDGDELSITKQGTDADATDDEEVSVSLSGSDQFVITKGTAVNMLIYADLSTGATSGTSHRMDITSTNSNVVTSQGATSGNGITEVYSTATASAMTVGTAGGDILVGADNENTTATLFAANTDVELARFNFFASTTEDVEIEHIYLTQTTLDTNSSSYKDFDEIWFEDESGNEIAGTRMTPTSTVPKINFSNDAFVIDFNDSDGQTLVLNGNLANIGSGANGVAAHYVGYKINAAGNIKAKGNSSGSASAVTLSTGSAPTGNTHYYYKSYPVVARVALNGALANGTNDLFKFTVSAVNNAIALYGFTFDFTTTGCDLTNLYLYDITSTEKVVNTTAGNPPATYPSYFVWQTTGADWDATNWPADEITVASGATKTFVLRGNVAGASSGDAITVKMSGDIAHFVGTTTLMERAIVVDNDTNDDFIWSDKSATSHAIGTYDWTNGFLVSGLPSNSSTAETTSL